MFVGQELPVQNRCVRQRPGQVERGAKGVGELPVSPRTPAANIHCDRAGSFASQNVGSPIGQRTAAGRGLKFGSSLRATSCQCGSGSPSFSPTPVSNTLIGAHLGIRRTKMRRLRRARFPSDLDRSASGRLYGGRFVRSQLDHADAALIHRPLSEEKRRLGRRPTATRPCPGKRATGSRPTGRPRRRTRCPGR